MTSPMRYDYEADSPEEMSPREFYYATKGEMGELRGEVGQWMGGIRERLGSLEATVRFVLFLIPLSVGVAGVALGVAQWLSERGGS